MPAKVRAESSKAQQKKALSSVSGTLAAARSVAWKLAKSTGRAGWITASTCLVLLVPLIIEMDREQQLVEFENQQLGALTGSTTGTK
jgi:import receptor subunit TOM22